MSNLRLFESNKAGFQWETNNQRGVKRKLADYQIDDKWMAMLARFKAQPDKSNLEDPEVKRWAETQRKMCKKGKVRKEKVDLLTEAEFDFVGRRGRRKAVP